ncbi:MAG: 6-carboxytetrahydropterin synthase QueD [Planctomycetota bacterium]
MRTVLTKTLEFDAAHRLLTFPEGHKCRGLHGHSFKVDIVLEGEVDPAKGYLVDFGEIKRAAKPLIDRLDHHYLNDIEGLEVPTAENLAKWFYDRLIGDLPMLKLVRVHETATSAAEYFGD